MFIITPLIVLVIALGAIVFISSRKFSYLRRLDTEHLEDGTQEIKGWAGFWVAMVPEVSHHFHKANVAGHKSSLLLEFEKFLRKLRLVSLRLNNFSDRLIHQIRTSHEHTLRLQEEAKVEASPEFTHSSLEQVIQSSLPAADLKTEEQKLIMEIAKTPKDPRLYKLLGDLYLKLEQLSDARESYDSALKLDPELKGVKRKLDSLNRILPPLTN